MAALVKELSPNSVGGNVGTSAFDEQCQRNSYYGSPPSIEINEGLAKIQRIPTVKAVLSGLISPTT
jgi:hypothetical protein